MKTGWRTSSILCANMALVWTAAAAPFVYDVNVAPNSDRKQVTISYRVTDPSAATVKISMQVSENDGQTWTVPANSFALNSAIGFGIPANGSIQTIVWQAGDDWSGHYSENMRVRIVSEALFAPTGMVLIPAGSFVMGNATNVFPSREGYSGEVPQHQVYVSAFYMGKYEVTKGEWDEVYRWATNHEYGFDYAGSGKAADHPVQTIDWYDVVKWCNARSQKEGLTPCYTVGGSVYKTGQSAPDCNWAATGYRLPTEAEWEKAARGGAANTRFPWSDVNTIDHSRANYYGYPSGYAYDLGYEGYDTNYTAGGYPYTSPVGAFAPNGYGLYDMGGNVWEWCWDWYDGSYYATSPGADPRGPASSPYSYRVSRGGSWRPNAHGCRVARRPGGYPYCASYSVGFRVVLPPGQ